MRTIQNRFVKLLSLLVACLRDAASRSAFRYFSSSPHSLSLFIEASSRSTSPRSLPKKQGGGSLLCHLSPPPPLSPLPIWLVTNWFPPPLSPCEGEEGFNGWLFFTTYCANHSPPDGNILHPHKGPTYGVTLDIKKGMFNNSTTEFHGICKHIF